MFFAGCCLWQKDTSRAPEGVQITRQADRLDILIDGRPFAQYHFATSQSRPFVYPIHGPTGQLLTRNWPIREVEHEEQDHPHHRSLWYAHGDINGVDFWSEGEKAGRTVHQAFTEIRSGREAGVVRSRNRWVARDGRLIATDERMLRFHQDRAGARLLDFEITLRSAEGPLTFGDTKEGTMSIRLAETLRLTPNKFNQGKPGGHIVNSEGVRDGDTWGKRARWVDYYGPVEGETVGVAIFDHPRNPQHPTWWHVRDYGLFAANPFGVHDFEKKPPGTGTLEVPAGAPVTFRYRFYFHRGTETEAQIAQRYAEYTRSVAP